jgi:hypothetical protein
MHLKIIFLTVFLLAIGCDPCPPDPHCPPPYDELPFALLSADGKDLLKGTAQKYAPADIKVFTLNAQQQRREATIRVENPDAANTVLYAYLFEGMERVFVEVQQQVTDTLDLTFQTTEHNCCQNLRTLDQIFLNGRLLAPGAIPVPIRERQ